jgi:hypothetical protein
VTLAVKHNAGDGVMFGVAESNESRRDPRFAASSCAGPEKTRNGSPLDFFRISMSRQPIALPMPVPNAFETLLSPRSAQPNGAPEISSTSNTQSLRR